MAPTRSNPSDAKRQVKSRPSADNLARVQSRQNGEEIEVISPNSQPSSR